MSNLYAVGIGPGGAEYMTREAYHVLQDADVICGYTVYVDLVKDLFPDKQYFTTGMRKEIERCRWAMNEAAQGQDVALVCSGDAGVYGMAGPLLEMSPEFPDVEVIIIPGTTAALSGGAVLGAPLMHDFCLISLSDLLTPWETIEKRLKAAADGDFSICLYNPRSHKRASYLEKACDILMAAGKAPETVCGWVKNIGREGQEYRVTTLGALKDEPVDMFTTVFIGNSTTKKIGDRMVTPRGYERKQK